MSGWRRFAAFDLGSNSFKYSLFEKSENRLRKIDDAREFTAIGDDVYARGAISAVKAVECIEALRRLNERAPGAGAKAAVATAAMRRAENGREIANRFGEALGCGVEILSGVKEARLLGLGVLGEAGCRDPAAVLDIGGGSVELIRSDGRGRIEPSSLDIGPIDLRQRHDAPSDDAAPSKEYLVAIRQTVEQEFAHVSPLESEARLFASGGGFTTLGDMLWGNENRPDRTVSLDQLREALDMMKQIPANELASIYNLPLRRARILPAGAVVAIVALECLSVSHARISWAGLREGLAWRAVDWNSPA